MDSEPKNSKNQPQQQSDPYKWTKPDMDSEPKNSKNQADFKLPDSIPLTRKPNTATTTVPNKSNKIVPNEKLEMENDDEDPKLENLGKTSNNNTQKSSQKATGRKKIPIETGIPIPPGTKGRGTLAFPSLATSTHNFIPKKAAKILVSVVYNFLNLHQDKKIKLMLVEKRSSPVLTAISKYMNNSEPRFQTIPGKELVLTKLKSLLNNPACFIVNETNWRMKPGGTEINKMVHEAAGPEFSNDTKSQFNTGAVTGAYPVALSANSKLFQEEGVHWVIHVIPPNMNPNKPDLITDMEEATKLLEKTYWNMLECFYELGVFV